MSTFIYFNNFDKEMNLTESNIKSDGRIQNTNDMSNTTNFQILSPVSSTSNLNFSPVKNSSHFKSLAMPLQHYMYEDLSSSNQFLEKKINEYKSNSAARHPKLIISHDRNDRKDRQEDVLNSNLKSSQASLKSSKKSNLSRSVQKEKGDFIINVPNLQTRIHNELFLNQKEILISEKKITLLPDDATIYDGEVMRINLDKKGYKKVMRYFQVTKREFKYFHSIFSSTVWNDKPLFRIKLSDIEKITVSDDDRVKIKFNDVKFVFKIHIKKENFKIQENYQNQFLEFGCEDPEAGVTAIKIILLIKKIIS